MTAITKLTAFLMLLAFVFVASFAIGRNVGPFDRPTSDGHETHVDARNEEPR